MTASPAVVSEEAVLLREDRDGIATLTLNRPRQYNALSLTLMETLIETLERIAKDSAVRVLILKGAGKGFCAGHDLKEIRSTPNREAYARIFETCSRLMLAITRLPKPVIAQVHGIATAAGCQLVATSDLAVASAESRFATPGANIGLFCSTPMVALSRNVPRKQAMEMLLTGEMISAQRALELGLINRVVEETALESSVADLAAAIAAKSPLTLKIGKEAFYRQLDLSLEEAYRYTAGVMTENMMARDAAEGVDAFLEKRPPEWRGE